MTAPTLLLTAVLIPLAVLAALLMYTRSVVWLGLRPRARALVNIALAMLFAAKFFYDLGEGSQLLLISDAALAVGWSIGAAYELRRGQVVRLE